MDVVFCENLTQGGSGRWQLGPVKIILLGFLGPRTLLGQVGTA
jgi:hypothetical protein